MESWTCPGLSTRQSPVPSFVKIRQALLPPVCRSESPVAVVTVVGVPDVPSRPSEGKQEGRGSKVCFGGTLGPKGAET